MRSRVVSSHKPNNDLLANLPKLQTVLPSSIIPTELKILLVPQLQTIRLRSLSFDLLRRKLLFHLANLTWYNQHTASMNRQVNFMDTMLFNSTTRLKQNQRTHRSPWHRQSLIMVREWHPCVRISCNLPQIKQQMS